MSLHRTLERDSLRLMYGIISIETIPACGEIDAQSRQRTLQPMNHGNRAPATSSKMNARKNDIAIAVYDWHSRAERAVFALRRAGCNMKRISVVGRYDEDQERVLGFLNTSDRVRILGKLGAFWGGLPGMLLDSAEVFIPVRGYVFVLGTFAAAKISSLQSTIMFGDTNALAGAMSAIGIPKESASRYETALNANEFILVAHGDEQDVCRVGELIETSGLVNFDHLHVSEEVAQAAYV
jgi:hypothetical protein